jgi:thiol-disulfide isomerase/thioredoxin
MVETIWNIDAMAFKVRYKVKKVFETDTITSFARVMVRKQATAIEFLLISPEEGEKELLFCQDTAWAVDHQMESLTFIGTTMDHLSHNAMAKFAPMDIFAIDTLIKQIEPFWQITEKNDSVTKINVTIKDQPKEVSGLNVEFTIGNNGHLIYKVLKEFVYMNADNMFEEQVFSDYTFPEADHVKIPEYYTIYVKDLGPLIATEQEAMPLKNDNIKDVYLEHIEIFSLDGTPYQFPEEGLIFIDLWYVGCAPCMKSAPVIEKIYHTFKDKVYFFSMNEMDRDTAKISRFCEKMGITFPVLLGGKEKIAARVSGLGAYPVFILMDAESRKVLWNMAGYYENLEEMISEAILNHL